jgi:hypothetical protein
MMHYCDYCFNDNLPITPPLQPIVPALSLFLSYLLLSLCACVCHDPECQTKDFCVGPTPERDGPVGR